MTRVISSVVIILVLSLAAQAFRQQPSKKNARKNAKDEANPDSWQMIRDHVLSGGAGSATSSGYVRAKHPAEEFPLGVYDITASSIAFPAQVRSGSELSSSLVTSLHNTGIEAVTVLEVVFNEADSRVQARIESPAGWMSLLDTRNGFRWATNRRQFCERQMSSPAAFCTLVKDKCYVLAGECLPLKLVVTVDSGFLEDQEFPLGTYDIEESVRVSIAPNMESQVLYRFGEIEVGETVTVLKVEYVATSTRVRAQIEQRSKGLNGWISLLDTSDNFRWATNRAAFCAEHSWYNCYWWYHHRCEWVEEGSNGSCAARVYPVKMN